MLKPKSGIKVHRRPTSSVAKARRSTTGTAGKAPEAETGLVGETAILEAIFAGATQAIFIKDCSGRYVAVNDTCLHYSALTRAEFIGKNDFQLFGSESAEIMRQRDIDVITSGETITYETSLTSEVLVGKTFQVTKIPLRDGRGRIVGLVGISQEITSLKAQEAKLFETISLIESTLESTADGIVAIDRRAKIVTFNRKFAELWGVAPEILAGQTCTALMQHILSIVRDPDESRDTIQYLRAHPEESLEDTVELTDGRVFHRFTQPQWLAGQAVGRVWSFRDVTEQTRTEERLAFRAFHDALTHLPNRALFFDRLERALAHSRRAGTPIALMFLDVDNLKSVNDNLGHMSGDDLLRELALRLRACVREGDTVARLSGDEFTVLLEEAGDRESALQVADRVIEALRRPLMLAGRSVAPIASIGLALGNGTESAEDLLWRADAAMYHSKAQGRGECVLYTEGMASHPIRHGTH